MTEPVDPLDQLDYYSLLEVPRDASTADVKRAFRLFARKFHPDRFAEAPDAKRERATRIYRRGSEAYQVLTDPIARKAYDDGLARGRLRLTADERERARAEAEAPKRPERKPEDFASATARAYYEKAKALLEKKDVRGAWQALRAAESSEPQNPAVKALLRTVEARLRSGVW
jgi:curved DNA-binding protein CbpA